MFFMRMKQIPLSVRLSGVHHFNQPVNLASYKLKSYPTQEKFLNALCSVITIQQEQNWDEMISYFWSLCLLNYWYKFFMHPVLDEESLMYLIEASKTDPSKSWIN